MATKEARISFALDAREVLEVRPRLVSLGPEAPDLTGVAALLGARAKPHLEDLEKMVDDAGRFVKTYRVYLVAETEEKLIV